MDTNIFQIDSEYVKKAYQGFNYEIEYTDSQSQIKYCTIYFSSNNIYYPNTYNEFRKRIIEQNYYEWRHYKIAQAHKHIYIRDIFKQWYLKGINEEINTPEKLLDFLKKETFGYKIITVGSSAGGYAAVLYGSLLNAEKVLAFNAQFEINSLLIYSKEIINPFVFRLKHQSVSKYYDTVKFIKNDIDIFYFYSRKSEWDVEQLNHVAKLPTIHKIGFHTSHHGIPILKDNLNIILNMNKEELIQLTKSSPYNVFMFSVKISGVKVTLLCWVAQMYKRYIKKVRNNIINTILRKNRI